MDASHELVAVAFVRSAGGRVRLLLCVDREGEQLGGGEPMLLVEHRPGEPPSDLTVEGPDGIGRDALEVVRAACCRQLAALVDGAFDDGGGFDGQRLLGRPICLRMPRHVLDM